MIWRRHLLLMFCMCCAAMVGAGQSGEVAGIAGYGISTGDEGATTQVWTVGASAAWTPSRHGVQVDYTSAQYPDRIFRHQFVTGSYLLQRRAGRVRPLMHVGAGVVVRTVDRDRLNIPPGVSEPLDLTSTDFALTFGFGVSVNVTDRFFVRPILRGYGYVGPRVDVVPSVGFGVRF